MIRIVGLGVGDRVGGGVGGRKGKDGVGGGGIIRHGDALVLRMSDVRGEGGGTETAVC